MRLPDGQEEGEGHLYVGWKWPADTETQETQKVLTADAVESRASGSFLPAVKDDDSHFVGSWEEVYMELF